MTIPGLDTIRVIAKIKEIILLIQILINTPKWVFILFIALLTLGFYLRGDRRVSLTGVLSLHASMLGLSMYGVAAGFGSAIVPVFFWMAGIGAAGLIGIRLGQPRGARYQADIKTFFVPGSWLPLWMMMLIFFIKFTVGVTLARHLPIASDPVFIGSSCFCYGLPSGMLVARALVILHTARVVTSGSV